MKSRKVKAYNASKRRKADIPLEASDGSDVDSDSFYHDEIDDFNNKKDDELSTDDELIQKKEESSEEEEVLPITDDEKEESEDQEESGSEDDDLPNRDAWGKKKSTYYTADFVDQDRGRTYREEDAEAAKAEEEEALAIQKSVYHNINADNLGAHLFFESSEESAEEEEIVNKDAATKEEIIKYLKKETKIFEYKELSELTFQKLKKVLKLWRLIQTRRIRSKRIETYVKAKKQILWLIIHNIDMYLMLLSTGKYNMKYHPVVKWIAHFKKLLDDFELKDQVYASAIDKLLEKKEDEIDITSDLENTDQPIPDSTSTSPKATPIVKDKKDIKKKKIKHMETKAEKEVMSFISEVKEEMKKRKLQELEKDDLQEDKDQSGDEDEANADEKRVISYEIAKNKGLVPHRKKEYRNPRVRHRMKYRKAQIRRKGQVRNVIKEVKRYEGEPTGININVVKSRKFK